MERQFKCIGCGRHHTITENDKDKVISFICRGCQSYNDIADINYKGEVKN